MRIAVIFSVLVAIGAAAVYTYSRSGKQGELDEIYAELKALPPVAKDFTTPEGAILCLEDAYRRRDIEAAVAAKDFKTEARLMLENGTGGFNDHVTDQLVAETAAELQVSFRAHATASWPDFEGLESFFTKRKLHSDKVVVVTEVCRFPDRKFSTQHLLVAQTADGWRVLNPIPE